MTVKKPIILNLLKHHKLYIKEIIKKVDTQSLLLKLLNDLKIIGNSQMDFYLGKLYPSELTEFSIQYLKSIDSFNKPEYIKWINNKNKDYQLVEFPDQSIWTFRYGKGQEDRYIHIHPARNSFLTTRIKASTLKTAIAFLAFSNIKKNNIELEIINHLRSQYLNLSSIKSLDKASEIIRCIELLK